MGSSETNTGERRAPRRTLGAGSWPAVQLALTAWGCTASPTPPGTTADPHAGTTQAGAGGSSTVGDVASTGSPSSAAPLSTGGAAGSSSAGAASASIDASVSAPDGSSPAPGVEPALDDPDAALQCFSLGEAETGQYEPFVEDAGLGDVSCPDLPLDTFGLGVCIFDILVSEPQPPPSPSSNKRCCYWARLVHCR